jgi:hypothetical protein
VRVQRTRTATVPAPELPLTKEPGAEVGLSFTGVSVELTVRESSVIQTAVAQFQSETVWLQAAELEPLYETARLASAFGTSVNVPYQELRPLRRSALTSRKLPSFARRLRASPDRCEPLWIETQAGGAVTAVSGGVGGAGGGEGSGAGGAGGGGAGGAGGGDGGAGGGDGGGGGGGVPESSKVPKFCAQ